AQWHRGNPVRLHDSRNRDEERALSGRPRSSVGRAAAADAARYVAIIVRTARLLPPLATRARPERALASDHKDWASDWTPCHCFSVGAFATSSVHNAATGTSVARESCAGN